MAENGADVDDPTPSRRRHAPRRLTCELERRTHVDCEDAVEVVIARLSDRSEGERPGIVDEHVESSGVAAAGRGEIGTDRLCFATRCDDRTDDGIGGVAIRPVICDHSRLMQQPCNRESSDRERHGSSPSAATPRRRRRRVLRSRGETAGPRDAFRRPMPMLAYAFRSKSRRRVDSTRGARDARSRASGRSRARGHGRQSNSTPAPKRTARGRVTPKSRAPSRSARRPNALEERQRLERLLDRRCRIEPVQLIEVDIIGAQPRETCCRSVIHRHRIECLRRDEHAFAQRADIRNRAPQNSLGLAI